MYWLLVSICILCFWFGIWLVGLCRFFDSFLGCFGCVVYRFVVGVVGGGL